MSGARIRAEVLAGFRDHVRGWLTGPQGPPPPDDAIEWLRFSGQLFKQIDSVGTHAALLLVKVPEIARWTDADSWPSGCTLFVPFQDPENVGAVIRSAAAFGAARVVLLREAAHPFLPRASRAAGPALFQVQLQSGPALADLQVKNAAADRPGHDRPGSGGQAVSRAVWAGRRRGRPRASRVAPAFRAATDSPRGGRRVAQRSDGGRDRSLRLDQATFLLRHMRCLQVTCVPAFTSEALRQIARADMIVVVTLIQKRGVRRWRPQSS